MKQPTHQEQFIAMLEAAGVDYEVSQGTYVEVRDLLFIFHIRGNLKEVYGGWGMEGC